MSKTVLFQTIQFSISKHFSSICPQNRTLSGTTCPGLSGPESDDNEGVLRIPQSSSITGTPLSDCLVLYPGHSLEGGVLPLCKKKKKKKKISRCILQPQPTGQYILLNVKKSFISNNSVKHKYAV